MTQAPATPELVERLADPLAQPGETTVQWLARWRGERQEAAETLASKERSLALAGETLMKLDLKIHELEALAARYEKALRNVRSLIAEGAAVGFNPLDGDWAERLFLSQQETTAALSSSQGRHEGGEG